MCKENTSGRNGNMIPHGLHGGFFVYNALGNEEILYADQNVVALFGCKDIDELREHTGNSFRGMIHPDDVDRIENNILAQTFNSGRIHDYVRYRIITKDGKIRYVEDFGHLLRDGENGAYFYVFIVDVETAVYENREQNSYAEMQIFKANKKVDRLTGFLNMTAFYENAQGLILDRAVEGDFPSSIVVFDILGLHDINRTLGHDEGDMRIRALAGAIRKYMPEESFIFRGHEAELIVVCKHKDEKSLMENISAVVNASETPVLFGIGMTSFGQEEQTHTDSETLLKALEEAQQDLRIKKMLDKKSTHSQALTSLVRALEEVDSDTEEHVERTQNMGLALGREVGLSDSMLTTLQLLCLLHDIGKIAVPLEILNKPGRLTDEEWAVLRSHPEKGYQIATATDELKPLAEGILYHHERWDGKGYPKGLSKDEIPILARIISIVDAYDAMVNDRAYRKAMSPERAKKEIRDNAGTQFDPYLAIEFLNLLEKNPELSKGAKTGSEEVRTFVQTKANDAGTGTTVPVAYSKYKLDLDDVIIQVDESFESITGYTREEAVGKMSQFDLIPSDEREYYVEQVKKQFTKGSTAYLKHPLKRKDGTVIYVICNGERYFDSSVRAFRSTILIYEVK